MKARVVVERGCPNPRRTTVAISLHTPRASRCCQHGLRTLVSPEGGPQEGGRDLRCRPTSPDESPVA